MWSNGLYFLVFWQTRCSLRLLGVWLKAPTRICNFFSGNRKKIVYSYILLNSKIHLPFLSPPAKSGEDIGMVSIREPSLVFRAITWRRIGDKPLPQTMLIQFTDAYIYGTGGRWVKSIGHLSWILVWSNGLYFWYFGRHDAVYDC